jgi:hypothetical protein
LLKTDLKDVPEFVDFQIPPPAEATYNRSGFLLEASISVILPLIAAGPIKRGFSAPSCSGFRGNCGKTCEKRRTDHNNKNNGFITYSGEIEGCHHRKRRQPSENIKSFYLGKAKIEGSILAFNS